MKDYGNEIIVSCLKKLLSGLYTSIKYQGRWSEKDYYNSSQRILFTDKNGGAKNLHEIFGISLRDFLLSTFKTLKIHVSV